MCFLAFSVYWLLQIGFCVLSFMMWLIFWFYDEFPFGGSEPAVPERKWCYLGLACLDVGNVRAWLMLLDKKKICGQVWIIFLSLSLGFAQLRPSSSNVRSFFLQSYEILQNWQPLFFECNQGSLHFSFLIRPMSMTRLIAILTSKVHKPDLFAFILFFL